MSFFDRILKSLEDFFKRDDGIDESLIRKFVSGVFYCNGRKQNHFALIIERNDFNREDDLLRELIDQFPHCSDMREYHGYSEEEVESGESEFIEVGTL